MNKYLYILYLNLVVYKYNYKIFFYKSFDIDKIACYLL